MSVRRSLGSIADPTTAGSHLAMCFADEGLVFGAGTILAHADPLSRNTSIERDGARLLALLYAAHLRLPPAHSLRHIAKAMERWREGEDALAAIHLALSGLDDLGSSAARRLDVADALLAQGCTPEIIIKALDLSLSSDEDLAKYDPQQPRVPAGGGRTSGQWTTDGGAASNTSAQDSRTAITPPTPGADPRQFTVELGAATFILAAEPDLGPFTDAVKAVADTVEIADSIAKWRELGPKGEEAIEAAVTARGWFLLGRQVRVETSFGLRVEDLLVEVPPGVLGNAEPYYGFIEVKVSGGRYSTVQRAKDADIYKYGGKLLMPIPGFESGQIIKFGTGLATVQITYEPEE